MTPTLYLASTSPARAQILRDIGLSAQVISPTVDEDAAVAALAPPHDAATIALHLAQLKAESVLSEGIDGLVLGGDQFLNVTANSWVSPMIPVWLFLAGRQCADTAASCIQACGSSTTPGARSAREWEK